MRYKLALLTEHSHVMVEHDALAQIVLKLGFPDERKLVEGVSCSAESLDTLAALIRAKHVLVEETLSTFVTLSEYFETIFEGDEARQRRLINISKETIGVNSHTYSLDFSIEVATRLKPKFKAFGLSFRDCLDLVLVSLSNTKFYISAKKTAIESCIAAFEDDFVDLKSLQIHDIDSFVSYVANDTTYLDVLANRDLIQVYTREGRPIAIKRSSTPVDFAYKIHTALGNACYQARVTRNYGREDEHSFDCDLDHVLEDGDKVEIIKRPDGSEKPDIAWCIFAVTDKAIDAIHAFWHRENISRGNALLKQAFGDCYLNGNKFRYISQCLHCGSIEALQRRLGAGEITLAMVSDRLEHYSSFIRSKLEFSQASRFVEASREEASPPVLGWSSNNFLLARCCHPMPGEDICGVVGKRATYVHHTNCDKISHLSAEKRRRLSWNTEKCTAVLKIRIKDREDITRCLLNTIVEHRVHVNLLNLSPATSSYLTTERTSFANICVLFESMSRLQTLVEDIENIHDVMQATIRNIFPGDSVYKDPPEVLRL